MRTSQAAAVLLTLAMLAAPDARAQGAERALRPLPEPLVYLRDIDPTILQDMRYAGTDNFTGQRVPGYRAAECVLLRETAEALSRVQRALASHNLSLKVYDCYRPRQAVRAFVAWVEDAIGDPDPLLKRFRPAVERSQLISLGYIAAVSRHSHGDTVDLTLVELPVKATPQFRRRAVYGACNGPAKERAPDAGVDMGTGFDCFDRMSYTRAPAITAKQRAWRQTLVAAMAKEGFRNYFREWWHFTLAGAHSARAFDVPILPRRP